VGGSSKAADPFLITDLADPESALACLQAARMARTAAPYLHPKIGVTEFVAPPRLGDDNEIRIVFVDPQGRHVPFKPPPELEAAATGPNTPQQLDLDRSEEDRQLLTR